MVIRLRPLKKIVNETFSALVLFFSWNHFISARCKYMVRKTSI
jgi:hypothetical protein